MGVGLTGARRRLSAWSLAAPLAALLVALPLIALPLSFAGGGDAWARIAGDLLPSAVAHSLLLVLGVGTGTLVLGTALAALVAFYDFPGRRWLEWALVLPLAMPAYVLTFVLLGQYDAAGALGGSLPDLRTPLGTMIVLTAVLYPYVYLLARSAFSVQSARLMEAARSLGRSHLQAIVTVALPMARPAIAAGTAIAVMEALADFGAVNLLGYRALTDAIYRVWYGAFDRQAALQLGSMLLALVLVLLVLERLARRRAAYDQVSGRGTHTPRRRLTGPRALLATALPVTLLGLVIAAPVVQLVAWAVEAVSEGVFDATVLAVNARNSLLLAFLAAVAAVLIATTVAYGLRMRPSRAGVAAARVVSVGYALPGSVVAICVFVLLAWIGERATEILGGARVLLTGTVLGLLMAYVVRFIAPAMHTTEAHLARVPSSIDAAARSLGAGPTRVLSEVHAPLLVPGVATAALLVFVEVMKELPATVLLRPLGLDTLAIAVWEATRESLYETAALPALVIVVAGLAPVIVLVRLGDRR